jgi:hypothetical protein
MRRRDRRRLKPSTADPMPGDSRSPHPLIQALLVECCGVGEVLDRLQGYVDAGLISREDVVLLARKWQDTLPPRRGVVKQLRDFMQLKLGFEIAAASTENPRRRRRKRRSSPLL